MTDTDTKPDEELDELAYLQRQARILVAYALSRGWITPEQADELNFAIGQATIQTIAGIFVDIFEAIGAPPPPGSGSEPYDSPGM